MVRWGGPSPGADGSHVSLLLSCLPSDIVVRWYRVNGGVGWAMVTLQQEQVQPTMRNAINQAH